MSKWLVVRFATDKFAIGSSEFDTFNKAFNHLNKLQEYNYSSILCFILYLDKDMGKSDHLTNHLTREIYLRLMSQGKIEEASIYLEHLKQVDKYQEAKIEVINHLIDKELIEMNLILAVPLQLLLQVKDNIKNNRELSFKPNLFNKEK